MAQDGAIEKVLEYLQNAIEHARDEGKNPRADAYQTGLDSARAELAALREALKAADEYIGALIENRRTNRQQVRYKVCLTGTTYRAVRAKIQP